MKKNYVLDTNVLIYEPESLFLFEDNDLYLCPVTFRELSGLKSAPGETGYAARKAKRILDSLREGGRNIKDGIPLGEGLGTLYAIVGTDFTNFTDGMSRNKPDDYILAGAAWLQWKEDWKEDGKRETILVTDDTDMAMLADIIGVKTEHFRGMRTEGHKVYSGRGELVLPEDFFKQLAGGVPVFPPEGTEMQPNEFFTVSCETTGGTLLAKADKGGDFLTLLAKDKGPAAHPFGVTARNAGQRFAISALMDPSIPLVILSGPAGTAKTFLSLAAGLEQVMEKEIYEQILITRANVSMDATYGYLPGTEEDKVSPMMRPFFDNLKELTKKGNKGAEKKDGIRCPSMVESLFEGRYIRAEAMEYMRGRSITDTFVIIDEAQNCTPSQILSIVSRIGEGSKIVLLGDPQQIDNRLLDEYNCGLTHASTRFITSGLCAQVTFKQCECQRSKLAMEAAERLSADWEKREEKVTVVRCPMP